MNEEGSTVLTLQERCRELEARNQALEEENRRLQNTIQSNNRLIRDTFTPYFTNEILDEILSSEADLRIGGERRHVTILFTDLRRSTELSEKMNAVDFIAMLNHYLEEMIELVNAWGGNILDFVGDAIVAVFGAPQDDDHAARNAVACSVAMQCRMEAVNRWNRDRGFPDIAMGIGIHTGDAIVGNIGSKTRTKYDIIGRNVNLASRIEGQTEGGDILISTETLHEAGEQVRIDPQRQRLARLKGVKGQILLHDVRGFGTKTLP